MPRDHFQVLSHRFDISWNFERAGTDVAAVLGGFLTGGRNTTRSAYALVDTGSDDHLRYQLTYEGVRLWAGSHPADVLDHLFWHVNSEAFSRESDRLLIHAGAVTAPSGSTVLLPATSGSGKSTLVAALVARAGFGFLSDEAAMVDPATLLVSAYPKAITLKGGLEGILPELAHYRDNSADPGRRHWHLPAADIRADALADPAPVSLVVFHRYAAGATLEVTPLTRASTTLDLAGNTMNLRAFPGVGLTVLAAIAQSAPGYRVVSPSLDASLGVIRDLV